MGTATDFRLPRDGGQIVTYNSGAGTFGLGPDGYEVEFDTRDERALRSLVGAHFDLTDTEYVTIDEHFRQ